MAGQINTSTVVTIAWNTAPNAATYEVEYRRDELNWERLPPTSATSIEIPNAWAGTYIARVRAVNVANVSSAFSYSQPLVVGDQELAPFFIEDVQSAVTALESSIMAVDQRSSNAANQAAAALAAASAVGARVADIASDNLLTPNEKPPLIQDWAVLQGEMPGIVEQAEALEIEDELAAYMAAYNELEDYLASLTTPYPWNNLSGNTVIDH
jgi:predicted phage tail protein